MLTLDANVWVSVWDLSDRFHAESLRFLREVTRRRLPVTCPAIVLVESGCAIARRTGDAGKAERAIEQMRLSPLLTVIAMDDRLLAIAMSLGMRHKLRGADAIYAATAERHDAALITWDRQLRERAGGVSPSEWLDGDR